MTDKFAKLLYRSLILGQVILCLAFATGTTLAANRALLVGVGDYPTLPEDKSLPGPPNDVRLMRQVLENHGFSPDAIVVLADGIEGAGVPTRNTILKALDQLVERTNSGDQVVLFFAGHGSRQPQPANAADPEPDRQDEIFLPRDIGRWDGAASRVDNAVIDDEIGRYIDALQAKGAFVWALFDTCHAGTMIRKASAADIHYRYVPESVLGIPEGVKKFVEEDSNRPTGDTEDQEPQAGVTGGRIAFYAAHPHETAPEMQLPQRSPEREWHGLLTYSVVEALQDPYAMTYRQLAQRVLQRYRARNIGIPTPQFEGDAWARPVLDRTGGDGAPQWLLQNRHDGMHIPVGQLGQIGVGSVLAVIEQAHQPTSQAIAYVQVTETSAFEAAVEPIAYGGQLPLTKKQVPDGAYARLIRRVLDFSIHVARPQRPAEPTPAERTALAAIEALISDPPQTGIPLAWVEPDDSAELHLVFTPAGIEDCPVNRLWITDANGTLICTGSDRTYSISLGDAVGPTKIELLKGELNRALQSIAKVLNLHRIAAQLTERPGAPSIVINFEVTGAHRTLKIASDATNIPNLVPGQKIRIMAKSKDSRPVDLTVLFVDSGYGIQVLFPTYGKSARINPGDEMKVGSGTINDKTQGLEHLFVIAVAAESGSSETSFSFLEQETLDSSQHVSRRGKGEALLQLFRQAGFGMGGTRGLDPLDRPAGMRVFRWRVAGSDDKSVPVASNEQ